MILIRLIILIVTSAATVFSQQISWVNVTSKYTLPSGIQIFEGSRTSPLLKIYYVDADLTNPLLSIRPYLSSTNYSVDNFNNKVGAYVSINGGYFGGNQSYSAVIYPNEVKATNVTVVSRNSKSYPLIRGMFAMKNDKTFSVDWIYNFGNAIEDVYKFNAPLPYISNDPNVLPTPLKTDGQKFDNLLTGIGGGPVLIKNGKINITYNEEIMWGSGVGFDNRDPRTAVGYKNNKHVIMIVADGRGLQSDGVGLPELAQIMLDLGCYEAINLDGGGSTQMAVGNSYVNSPAGVRAVPAILSIVHSDSLKTKPQSQAEKIIDTEDNSVTKLGNWFESANSGFYGSSKSLLLGKGSGLNYINYNLNIAEEKKYELYAWWVSASNRCADTPYIINNKTKADTVKVDQTKNGSTWQKLGVYTFKADSTSWIKITDGATIGTYVTADAIKIVALPNSTSVKQENNEMPSSFVLYQNYPNPFNPTTEIEYRIPETGHVTLKVFDILGREVETLVDEVQQPGVYHSTLNTLNSALSSGVYFYRLQSGNYYLSKKLVLLK